MKNPYLSDTDVMASLAVEDTLETRTVEKQEWTRLLLTEAMIKARKSVGLTQKQLAKLLGKTQGWVSKLESANHNHELESIVEYLTALNAELLMVVRQGVESLPTVTIPSPETINTSSMSKVPEKSKRVPRKRKIPEVQKQNRFSL
jgi:transcriptional regulator with XRE-family HTH domain